MTDSYENKQGKNGNPLNKQENGGEFHERKQRSADRTIL